MHFIKAITTAALCGFSLATPTRHRDHPIAPPQPPPRRPEPSPSRQENVSIISLHTTHSNLDNWINAMTIKFVINYPGTQVTVKCEAHDSPSPLRLDTFYACGKPGSGDAYGVILRDVDVPNIKIALTFQHRSGR